jgi:phage baseplate assembly protein W
MARIIRINPLDLKPNTAIGVNIPFNGNAVFRSTYTSKDATRANLINFFLTNQNERLFNPFFGANLRKQIFEQLTKNTIDGLDDLITNSLEIYFPRVIVNELKLTPDPDSNTLYIFLSYKISETNIEDQLTLSFVQ